jgi:hypothetical protein
VGLFFLGVLGFAVYVAVASQNPVPAFVILGIFGIPLAIFQAWLSESADGEIYNKEWREMTQPRYSVGDYSVVITDAKMRDFTYDVRVGQAQERGGTDVAR